MNSEINPDEIWCVASYGFLCKEVDKFNPAV